MKSKRTFSREYKLAAVKKIVEQGQSYSEVAKDLGVKDGLLRNWRKKFEAEGVLSLSPPTSVEEELRRLREENRGVVDYIERFYNRIRRHSSLGYVSPIEFEQSQLFESKQVG